MVIWTSCAAFFRLILPSMMDWGVLEKQNTRSEKAELNYSQKWQRTTLSVDHQLGGLLISHRYSNSGFAQIPRMAYGAPCGVCA